MFIELANRLLLFTVELSEKLAPLFGKGLGSSGAAGISVGLENGSTGLIIIIFLIFAFFVIGMALGKTRLAFGGLSIFIAYFLEKTFPFHREVSGYFSGYEDYLVRGGIFLFFYILAFLFLNQAASRSRFTLSETPFFTVLILGVVQAGFLASVLFSYLPESVSASFTPQVKQFFTAPNTQFYWALLLLISFVFLSRRRKKTEMASKEQT